MSSRKTRSIKTAVSRKGTGLFTGKPSTIRLVPADPHTGIVVQRIDLEGNPFFEVDLSHVKGTPQCTIVGDDRFSVQTVEHLMAALFAYKIDNLIIELSGPEVPIFDGSSKVFVEMIEEAEIFLQEEEKKIWFVDVPLIVEESGSAIIALPSKTYKISYTLDYPHCLGIGTQFYEIDVTTESFRNQISSCRTFSIYEEVAPLIEKGVIRGGSLENAVVIRDNQVVNPDGLRFKNEMVRHKILDLIGDMGLMGIDFVAHIVALKSGHRVNNLLAAKMSKYFKGESL